MYRKFIISPSPFCPHPPPSRWTVIGSLSNDVGYDNENGKKAIGFFVHFFAVTARLRRENALFHVLWVT